MIICFERNNHGHSVTKKDKLKEEAVYYRKIPPDNLFFSVLISLHFFLKKKNKKTTTNTEQGTDANKKYSQLVYDCEWFS